MPIRARPTASLSRQATELALAAPMVVAHRLTRMAMAGPLPSTRDRREFHLMSHEKVAAFQESWTAMTLQALAANQSLMLSCARAFWSPWLGGAAASPSLASEMQGAWLGILAKGMAPVHRKATGNARRLARTRLR